MENVKKEESDGWSEIRPEEWLGMIEGVNDRIVIIKNDLVRLSDAIRELDSSVGVIDHTISVLNKRLDVLEGLMDSGSVGRGDQSDY